MNENEFGYRIRQALNEGADRIDYKTAHRLEQARGAAVARLRPQANVGWVPASQVAARPGYVEFGRGGWLRTLGVAAPLLALIVGFVSIYEWQHQRHITELADMDFAVLLDTNPIGAYADKSFSVLLQTSEEL
jgi:hypothetical protein